VNKRGLLVTSFLVILLRELNTEKALAMHLHGQGFFGVDKRFEISNQELRKDIVQVMSLQEFLS